MFERAGRNEVGGLSHQDQTKIVRTKEMHSRQMCISQKRNEREHDILGTDMLGVKPA